MSEISPVCYDQFFAPLVGSPEAHETTHLALVDGIRSSEAPNDGDELYQSLDTGLRRAVHSAALDITDIEHKDRKVLIRNGTAGILGSVIIARGIGATYKAEKPDVPQEYSNVHRNTVNALIIYHGLAMSGQRRATGTMLSFFQGANPYNPITRNAAKTKSIVQIYRDEIQMKPKAFEVHEGENGQLDIRPKRFKKPRWLKSEPNRCPASVTQVVEGESKRGALVLFLGMIADVVVDEVYPHIIDMTPNPTR